MRFLDIVGYNVALKSLTAEHIRHYRDMMHAIPSNFEKRGFSIPRARSARPKWLDSRLPLNTLKNIVGHRGDFKTYGIVYEEQEGATGAYIHSSRISEESRLQRLQAMKRGMDSMDFGVDLSHISFSRFLERK